MSRYIDAEWLIKEAMPLSFSIQKWVNEVQINDAPSIDIVRCRECRWGKPYSDKQLECDALGLGGLRFPDDFCSYGNRSEKPNNSND